MNQRKRGAYGTRYGWQSIILFKHCACWFVVYADDSRYLLETAYVAGQPYQYLVSAGYWYASVAENEELGHGEVFPGFSCSTEQLFETTSKSPDLVVVLHSQLFQMSFQQTHHAVSTVGDHSMHVAFFAVCIAQVLNRMGMHIEMKSVVRAALCHDLGIIGERGKFGRKLCSIHPMLSVQRASFLLPDLNYSESDAIRAHMFPATPLHHPHTIIGWIISVADKIAAIEEMTMPGRMRKKDGITRLLFDECCIRYGIFWDMIRKIALFSFEFSSIFCEFASKS